MTPPARQLARQVAADDQLEILEWLRVLGPFSPFNEEELAHVVPYYHIAAYPAGATLIEEHTPSDNRVYFLLAGSASVYVNDKFILNLMRPGDIFGEMSLVSDEPRSATVRTDVPSRFLEINAALDLDKMEGLAQMRLRYLFTRMFSHIMAEKLRITSERAKMYETAVLQRQEVEAYANNLDDQVQRNLHLIRLYSHLVESSADGIVLTDLEGLVERCNPAMQQVFNLPEAETLGMQFGDMVRFADGVSWEQVKRSAEHRGWRGEVYVGPARIPAIGSVSLVCDAHRQKLAYAVMLQDNRERKTYEVRIISQQRALAQANQELKAMDLLKDKFMTLVSHELRTPLTSILAYTEMLTLPGMADESEREQFLGVVLMEARRLANLVDKITAISKFETNQMLLRFEQGLLDGVLRMELERIQAQAQDKGLKLEVHLPTFVTPSFFDEIQVRELLHQVLDNALKFTTQGSLCLRLVQNEDASLIRIKDTGKGMPKSYLTRVFSKFEQLERYSEKGEGIGLGLPLAYHIVRAHGGTIRLHSRQEQGTRVSILLPHRPPKMNEAP